MESRIVIVEVSREAKVVLANQAQPGAILVHLRQLRELASNGKFSLKVLAEPALNRYS